MAAVTIATRRTSRVGVTDRDPGPGPTTRPGAPHPAVAAGRGRPRRASRATYVRRRLSAVGMAVAVVLVTAQAGAALGESGSTPDVPGRAPTFAQVVVRPGDSLWSLAERLAPASDPRPVVDALRDARDGAPLLVGETVRWAG